MPYPTDSSVPSYVPAEHRAQWRHVWNSAFDRTKDEETAFKEANGVIKKAKTAASELFFGSDGKISKSAAGYMELDGAVEDARCHIVSGGISLDLGCCNLFNPEDKVKRFSCGTCTFHGDKEKLADVQTPLSWWIARLPGTPA